jgi:hypothetical protein
MAIKMFMYKFDENKKLTLYFDPENEQHMARVRKHVLVAGMKPKTLTEFIGRYIELSEPEPRCPN